MPQTIEAPVYPEHDKLEAIKDQSQAIGEFIEWLTATGYTIALPHQHAEYCYTLGLTPDEFRAKHGGSGDGLARPNELKAGQFNVPQCGCRAGQLLADRDAKPEKLIARHFEINLDTLEKEKRAMLDDLRKNLPDTSKKVASNARTFHMVGKTENEVLKAIADCNDLDDARAIRDVLKGDGYLSLAMKAASRIDKLRRQ